MERHLRHPSRPALWSGTELVPVEPALPEELEVWAGWTENGTRVWEALNAIRVSGEATVRLLSVPAYAYGLNYGDIVDCVASAEGPLVIRDVRSLGGQATFRIWLGADTDPSAWRPIAESYAKSHCIVDVLTASLMAVSCALEDSKVVRAMLEGDAIRTGFAWEPGTPAS